MKEQVMHYAANTGFAVLIVAVGAVVIKVLSGVLRKAITRADGKHALVVRFAVSAAEKIG